MARWPTDRKAYKRRLRDVKKTNGTFSFLDGECPERSYDNHVVLSPSNLGKHRRYGHWVCEGAFTPDVQRYAEAETSSQRHGFFDPFGPDASRSSLVAQGVFYLWAHSSIANTHTARQIIVAAVWFVKEESPQPLQQPAPPPSPPSGTVEWRPLGENEDAGNIDASNTIAQEPYFENTREGAVTDAYDNQGSDNSTAEIQQNGGAEEDDESSADRQDDGARYGYDYGGKVDPSNANDTTGGGGGATDREIQELQTAVAKLLVDDTRRDRPREQPPGPAVPEPDARRKTFRVRKPFPPTRDQAHHRHAITHQHQHQQRGAQSRPVLRHGEFLAKYIGSA